MDSLGYALVDALVEQYCSKCEVTVPTTKEELLDVLRRMKDVGMVHDTEATAYAEMKVFEDKVYI